jgi:membrane-associated protein
MMGAGVALGGLEVVRKHFEKVVILIVLVSVLPMALEFWKHRQAAKQAKAE